MQSDIQNYIAKGFTPTLVNQSALGAVVLLMNNVGVISWRFKMSKYQKESKLRDNT